MTNKEITWITLTCIGLYFLIGLLWAIHHWRVAFRLWVHNREYRIVQLRSGEYENLLQEFSRTDEWFVAMAICILWPLVWPFRGVCAVWDYVVRQLAYSALPPEPPKPKATVLGEAPSYRELPEEKEWKP